MNYINIINNFWNMQRTNPVSATAVTLFFTILHHMNISRWSGCVCLTNTYLQGFLHMSKSMFMRTRNELADKGYISHEFVDKIIGSKYYIYVSDVKGDVELTSSFKAENKNDFEKEGETGFEIPWKGSETEGESAFKSDCKADGDAEAEIAYEAENRLSSYNIKNKNININKNIKENYKQKRFYNKNNAEIYDSGRYDFETIERKARERIHRAVLAAQKKACSSSSGECDIIDPEREDCQ